MSVLTAFRLRPETAFWLEEEAKKQGKSKTQIIEFALENLQDNVRQTQDKLHQIWNDNGRIIAMLTDLVAVKSTPDSADSAKLDSIIEGLRIVGVASITASLATEKQIDDLNAARIRANKAMEKALKISSDNQPTVPVFDPEMMPRDMKELNILLDKDVPNSLAPDDVEMRQRAIQQYGREWRKLGYPMPNFDYLTTKGV